MSTRQIKDIIDTSTNQPVYPKSHAMATYMSDGSTVEDAINSIKLSGGGDISVLSNYYTKTEIDVKGFLTSEDIEGKQDELVSGSNIKTIFGETILGEGEVFNEYELAIPSAGVYHVEHTTNPRIINAGVTQELKFGENTMAAGPSLNITLLEDGTLIISGTPYGTKYLSSKVIPNNYLPKVDYTINTTYSDLVNKVNHGILTPGMWYRITDYETTTVQANTISAGHNFDILVLATSNNTLSEEAKAITRDGDEYFSSSNLNAWKIWYNLNAKKTSNTGLELTEIINEDEGSVVSETDVEIARFEWGDVNDSKGVIYRMIDEFNNECPYDFKNIMFLHNDEYYYTFSHANNGITDASVSGNIDKKRCYGNTIKHYIKNNVYSLPKNLFISTATTENFIGFKSNELGVSCRDNIFGDNTLNNNLIVACFGNTFGDTCQSNVMDLNCSGNTLGNGCISNIFKQRCFDNVLGGNGSFNTLGGACKNNTFNGSSRSNELKYESSGNTFGDVALYNILGEKCCDNVMGSYFQGNNLSSNCSSNIFGDYNLNNQLGRNCNNIHNGEYGISNNFGNNCEYIIIPDFSYGNKFGVECEFINLNNEETGANNNKINLYNFSDGVDGTSSEPLNINVKRNVHYETKVALNSNGELKMYCEADLFDLVSPNA